MGCPEFEVVSFFSSKFFACRGSHCWMKMKDPEAAGCGFFQSTSMPSWKRGHDQADA